MRRAIRQIHLIASLIAGAWLAVSGVTGSLLVFGQRLDEALHPELYHVVDPGDAAAPLSSVIAAAERASGGRAIRLRLAGSQTPVHEVWLDCDTCRRAWVDPSTATVRGIRSAHGTTRTFLHEFHRRLFLGKTGDWIAGTGGLVLVLLAVSGIILGWPNGRRWGRALTIRVSAGWRRLTYDGHRAVGLVTAPLLMVSGLTGAYFVFHSPVDRLAAKIQPAAPVSFLPITPGGRRLPLDELVSMARPEFPGAELTWLTLPAEPADPLMVRFRQSGEEHPNGRSFVGVDPYAGAVVGRIDANAAPGTRRLLNNLYPLHIGVIGGIPHRWLLVLTGLLPLAFFVSGIVLWIARTRTRKPSG